MVLPERSARLSQPVLRLSFFAGQRMTFNELGHFDSLMCAFAAEGDVVPTPIRSGGMPAPATNGQDARAKGRAEEIVIAPLMPANDGAQHERGWLIAKQRNTVAKRQRENDKRRKAEDKRAKRADKKSGDYVAERPVTVDPEQPATW